MTDLSLPNKITYALTCLTACLVLASSSFASPSFSFISSFTRSLVRVSLRGTEDVPDRVSNEDGRQEDILRPDQYAFLLNSQSIPKNISMSLLSTLYKVAPCPRPFGHSIFL
ncbi:hypothetical protein BKA57DRAFT_458502, partial [Linnemannia elongata]